MGPGGKGVCGHNFSLFNFAGNGNILGGEDEAFGGGGGGGRELHLPPPSRLNPATCIVYDS